MAAAEVEVIVFEQVRFSYRPGAPVISTGRLAIEAGLRLLLGPNGSGKSTLLRLAAGVEHPIAGTVSVDGLDLWKDEAAARRPIAYVPEQPELTPYASVIEVLRLVARLRKAPTESAARALERAGLAALGGRSIREMSMGQRRRAVLAAAWIGEPKVVLLDEPLEGMDRRMQESILDWVRTLDLAGAVIVVATHDLDPFAGLARRAIGFDGAEPSLATLPAEETQKRELLERLARGSREQA
jgi:ABC-type multidrug transport system ATPase subunit